MLRSLPRPTRVGSVAGAMGLLVAVSMVLAVIHAGQPLHLHRGATTGLYNEAHVLAALESITGDAALPAPGPDVQPALEPTRAERSAHAASEGTPLGHADSRAPPTA